MPRKPVRPIPDIVGKTTEEAEKILKDVGLIPRLQMVNGEALWGTADYRLDRVNLFVANATVVKTGRYTVEYTGGIVTGYDIG
jgi:hypothetical protein